MQRPIWATRSYHYFVKIFNNEKREKVIYLGRYSEMIERLGGRVTAPIKRTIFG